MYILWYAEIPLGGFALYSMWRTATMKRLPVFWSWVCCFVVRALTILLLLKRPVAVVYAYSAFNLAMIVLFLSAAVEIFWAVTEKYPKFRRLGRICLVALLVIGASLAIVTSKVAVPEGWSGLWKSAMLAQRCAVLAVSVVLGGIRLIPKGPGIPIRPSAARAAEIMATYGVLSFASSAFVIATGDGNRQLSALLSVVSGFVTAILLAVLMRRVSNECPEAVVRPAGELQRLMETRDANAGESLRTAPVLIEPGRFE
jgi:hypothetical protein